MTVPKSVRLTFLVPRIWVWLLYFWKICGHLIRKIQINQPTRCNSFTSLLFDVYVWLNMFRAPLRPSSGAEPRSNGKTRGS